VTAFAPNPASISAGLSRPLRLARARAVTSAQLAASVQIGQSEPKINRPGPNESSSRSVCGRKSPARDHEPTGRSATV